MKTISLDELDQPFATSCDIAVARAWRSDAPDQFPNTIDITNSPIGAEEIADVAPASVHREVAIAVRELMDKVCCAAGRDRKPTLRRTWSSFVVLLDLMAEPMLADLNVARKAWMAGVSQPTYIALRRVLSCSTGLPIDSAQTDEQRAKIARGMENMHGRRANNSKTKA